MSDSSNVVDNFGISSDQYDRTVYVSGLPEETKDTSVHIHFQKKKNGGGEVKKVTLLTGGRALVVFEDPKVARTVVNTQKKFKEKALEVKGLWNEKSEKEKVPRTLLVSGLPGGATENSVHIHFQKRKNGGGEVEKVQMLEEGKALVVFESSTVAKKVAITEQKFQGTVLQVELAKTKSCVHGAATLEKDETSNENTGTILVSGLPEEVTENTVHIHFQKKKNNGGEIRQIILHSEKNEALVIFEDKEVAKKVADTKQTFKGKVLDVKLQMPGTKLANIEELEESAEKTRTIMVSNLPNGAAESTIHIHFQKKKNGGGGIEKVEVLPDGNSAFVVFEDPEVAKRVADTEQTFKGHVLNVKLQKTDSLAENSEESAEKTRTILVSNLPEGITENTIHIHFQKKKNGGGDIEKVEVLPGGNSALVVFEDPEVAKRVAYTEQTFKGYVLNVKLQTTDSRTENSEESAEKTRTILVSNLPEGMTESAIHIHFQKKKNGGGEVEKVEVLPGGNSALVVFEDPEVAKRAVATPQEIKGKFLTVKFLNKGNTPDVKTAAEVETVAKVETVTELETLAEVETAKQRKIPEVEKEPGAETVPETVKPEVASALKTERTAYVDQKLEETRQIPSPLLPTMQIDQVYSMVTATVNPELLNTGSTYFWTHIFNVIQGSCGVQCQPSAFGILFTGSLSQVIEAAKILELQWRKYCQASQTHHNNGHQSGMKSNKSGQEDMTFDKTGTTFNQTGTNFNPAGTNFSQSDTNFNPVGTRFDQTGSNFNRSGPNFYQTSPNSYQFGQNFDQTRTNFNQGGMSYSLSSTYFNQADTNLNQTGTTSNQIGPNFNQRGTRFNQSGPNFELTGTNVNQGGENFNQSGPIFNHNGLTFNQTGMNFNQSGPNIDLTDTNFNQGGKNVDQSGVNFNQSCTNFNQTCSNFCQPDTNYGQGGTSFSPLGSPNSTVGGQGFGGNEHAFQLRPNYNNIPVNQGYNQHPHIINRDTRYVTQPTNEIRLGHIPRNPQPHGNQQFPGPSYISGSPNPTVMDRAQTSGGMPDPRSAQPPRPADTTTNPQPGNDQNGTSTDTTKEAEDRTTNVNGIPQTDNPDLNGKPPSSEAAPTIVSPQPPNNNEARTTPNLKTTPDNSTAVADQFGTAAKGKAASPSEKPLNLPNNIKSSNAPVNNQQSTTLNPTTQAATTQNQNGLPSKNSNGSLTGELTSLTDSTMQEKTPDNDQQDTTTNPTSGAEYSATSGKEVGSTANDTTEQHPEKPQTSTGCTTTYQSPDNDNQGTNTPPSSGTENLIITNKEIGSSTNGDTGLLPEKQETFPDRNTTSQPLENDPKATTIKTTTVPQNPTTSNNTQDTTTEKPVSSNPEEKIPSNQPEHIQKTTHVHVSNQQTSTPENLKNTEISTPDHPPTKPSVTPRSPTENNTNTKNNSQKRTPVPLPRQNKPGGGERRQIASKFSTPLVKQTQTNQGSPSPTELNDNNSGNDQSTVTTKPNEENDRDTTAQNSTKMITTDSGTIGDSGNHDKSLENGANTSNIDAENALNDKTKQDVLTKSGSNGEDDNHDHLDDLD